MRTRLPDELTRIRTDMRKSFAKISLLAVNAGLFLSPSAATLEIARNLSPRELLGELSLLGTRVVFYGARASDRGFVRELREAADGNRHLVLDARDPGREMSREKSCALVGCEESDVGLLRPGVFSVASRSADLSLKTVSDYVSNFDGEAVFEEVGNLVVDSKRAAGRRFP